MAHRVETRDVHGRQVCTLLDEVSKAQASVIPALGFNLFDLQLPWKGALVALIAVDPKFLETGEKPSHGGTPVLFPYPNRVRGGRFEFGGKTYNLPINNGPNAIHGFAIEAPFDVLEHKANKTSAHITARYQISKNSPDHLKDWPADAILEMTYKLTGPRLSLDVTVRNPTDRPLPFGFGIHPYFRLPWAAATDPAETLVVFPAAKYWPLVDNLPTGEILPVDARMDFRKGQPLAGLKLDDVLTDLPKDNRVCRLIDKAAGGEFRLSVDRGYRELVVFTPPWDPRSIAVEPYTQTTDAINLQAEGKDAGLRVLGHDESASFSMSMELGPASR